MRIAIIIPCYNEAQSIATVVRDFATYVPQAEIYVYDNNSTDDTAPLARAAGAVVRKEMLQGKGNVVRRMFADIEADVYVMVDGDGTYDASAVVPMLEIMVANKLDFVNGKRVTANAAAYRFGHRTGNRLLNFMVSAIFGRQIEDMLSGLKLFSRRFVKSFPCLTGGFELETELTIHALELRMATAECIVPYRERAPGSASKLNTIRDGIKIFALIAHLIRAERPTLFFGTISGTLMVPALVFGAVVWREYQKTRLVLRLPTAVLATGLVILAALSACCGLILETVTLGRREQKRMTYLSRPYGSSPDSLESVSRALSTKAAYETSR